MYATQSDMESRFGTVEILQLTDHANSGAVNVTVLNQALSDAQAVIDGYLRSAYSLPLPSTPAELVRVCCDLSRFFLYDDRVTETVQRRRDEALTWLRDVSAGRTSLGLDVSGEAVPASTGGVQFSASPRVFNASTLAGFL